MRSFSFTLLLILVFSPLFAQVYVDAAATGGANDGSSWANAYTDLQAALRAAPAGSEVFVAGGTYFPSTQFRDPTATFNFSKGLSVYGGFRGTEGSLAERDVNNLVPTLLSGDYAGNDEFSVVDGRNTYRNYGENADRLLILSRITGDILFDGFQFRGGDGTSGAAIAASVTAEASYSLTFRRCTFSNFLSTSAGGAINVQSSGNSARIDLTLDECIVENNRSLGDKGGAIFGAGYRGGGFGGFYINTIFRGNQQLDGRGAAINHDAGAVAEYQNCLFTNNVGQAGGATFENIDGDASYLNCTFVGNQSAQASTIFAFNDFGSPTVRLRNCVFGENEGPLFRSRGDLSFSTSYSLFATDPRTLSSINFLDVERNRFFTDPEFSVEEQFVPTETSPLVDAGFNGPVSQQLDLAGRDRIFNGTVDIGAYEYQPPATPGPVYYVDLTATGANNGTSWANAFTNLQTAIETAAPGDTLLVARGTYFPSPTGDRSAFFTFSKSLFVYGGFDGTESNLAERDTNDFVPTLISGDYAGNDAFAVEDDRNVYRNRGDNAERLLSLPSIEGDILVDGFAFEGTDGVTSRAIGVSVAAGTSAVTFRRCRFTALSSRSQGGALGFSVGGSGNQLTYTLDRCLVENSSTTADKGGAIQGNGNAGNEIVARYRNTIFRGNRKGRGRGGAINHDGAGSASYENCLFDNNSAEAGGATFENFSGGATFTNCTFVNNSSPEASTVFQFTSFGSEGVDLRNCVFAGNEGPLLDGRGRNAFRIANSLFPGARFSDNTFATVTDQGGNLFGSSPAFVDAAAGDYRPAGGSPLINAGDNSFVTTSSDLAGGVRIIADAVDLGAYEADAETVPVYEVNRETLDLSVYPNPFVDRVVLHFPPNSELAGLAGKEVDLIDVGGRRLRHFVLPSGNTIELPLAGLPNGTYFLQLTTGGDRYVARLLKH